MTELLAQTDAYLREFDAVVTGTDAAERAVALDRTAFYPGGGGQPCDLGSLAAGADHRSKRCSAGANGVARPGGGRSRRRGPPCRGGWTGSGATR